MEKRKLNPDTVLDGLNRCINGYYGGCDKCPYSDVDEWGECRDRLLKDAIAVIEQLRKEQRKA